MLASRGAAHHLRAIIRVALLVGELLEELVDNVAEKVVAAHHADLLPALRAVGRTCHPCRVARRAEIVQAGLDRDGPIHDVLADATRQMLFALFLLASGCRRGRRRSR